ncbi:(d)CMP kinase [Oceanobacillus iheyensis]|uniref:Cytidylate kinase n=1 Tax=Oceanobacillus iheyensis (strain DSM 14371 / CIP 107618 / JCM 11309 / KCTC 3954 / HTE831) TaxID=221109 RepID=KCY_OCEIH|nr:(d)CMP kinase [Oceanobacillus iheyensis]Q8CXF5.1 RecName: Full=Cytidylate kinase; Short=CK; AltName: Full=Cytidine monophosphate kinase; Short=CMP kinase [Oceanobacillus iheyensis HTE831]BAC13758.1 cytidylate kinase (cytidine monophosphate kinase) [Oceanobacillus iheyensis HTE831]
MEQRITVAIDGPAAAGKSTVAKMIANQLGFIYVDTGAMYRALTYQALQEGIDPKNEDSVLTILMNSNIELRQAENGQRVFVNNKDVSEEIRYPDVTSKVSFVAEHPSIRKEMVSRQQKLANNRSVVMDGRDIGTHVLPDAEVKIFLIASVEERAKRRHEENIKKGIPSDIKLLKKEISDRDEIDSNREVSPLIKAEDAIEVDTTSLSIAEVKDQILNEIFKYNTQNNKGV